MKSRLKLIADTCLMMTIVSLVNAQNAYVLAEDNPFEVVQLSRFASPALGDIDADGDPDMFIGQLNSNVMLFYRNIGTAEEPVFEAQTGEDNPLDIYSSNSGGNAPVLVDIDADGDLDVFVGIWTHIIRHLENEGDTANPSFVFKWDINNPLDLVLTEGICSYPAFMDVDADNDLDVFITDGNGNIEFYKNTGDVNTPVFEPDSADNVLGHLDLTERTKIVFHDVSGDGLFDAVIGHGVDTPELLYFENTGTAESPVFEERTGSANPFGHITGNEALVPAFVDIDADGDADLIVGTQTGVVLYEAVQPSAATGLEIQSHGRIYPNPATGLITIDGSGSEMIDVLDDTGRLFTRVYTGSGTTQLDLRGATPGLYVVRITGEAGTSVDKIVLQTQ